MKGQHKPESIFSAAQQILEGKPKSIVEVAETKKLSTLAVAWFGIEYTAHLEKGRFSGKQPEEERAAKAIIRDAASFGDEKIVRAEYESLVRKALFKSANSLKTTAAVTDKISKFESKFKQDIYGSKLNESLNEDYIESMGDEFDDGLALIIKAWLKWKKGPMTEPRDIKPARKEILDFIAYKLH